MTPLNTIIEEETKWEDDFRKQFDELKLKPPKNSMPNAERELIIWYFRNRITTAMQRAYEAGEKKGREEERERIWREAKELPIHERRADLISLMDLKSVLNHSELDQDKKQTS